MYAVKISFCAGERKENPKARYTLATKLNSTRSSLLKVDKIDRVALAPYTLATKSTVSATKLNVYGNSRPCCRFVAGFGNSRLSTKSTVLNSTLSPVCTGLKCRSVLQNSRTINPLNCFFLSVLRSPDVTKAQCRGPISCRL